MSKLAICINITPTSVISIGLSALTFFSEDFSSVDLFSVGSFSVLSNFFSSFKSLFILLLLPDSLSRFILRQGPFSLLFNNIAVFPAVLKIDRQRQVNSIHLNLDCKSLSGLYFAPLFSDWRIFSADFIVRISCFV